MSRFMVSLQKNLILLAFLWIVVLSFCLLVEFLAKLIICRRATPSTVYLSICWNTMMSDGPVRLLHCQHKIP